jgi:hypothetical protein
LEWIAPATDVMPLPMLESDVEIDADACGIEWAISACAA